MHPTRIRDTSMKNQIFLTFVLLISTLNLRADFVEMSFEGQNMPVEEALSHFNEWFGTGDSEYVLFFDETDEIGMRDMDYQQYVDGIKIENCALFVHSRNGFVTMINGDVMPVSKKPAASTKILPKRALQIATKKDTADLVPQKMIIHKQNAEGSFEYFHAYRVVTELEEIYVDCSTGDIIQTLPLSHNATTCSIETKYNGSQSIICETNTDGKYILQNSTKNLRTLYANFNSNTSSLPESRYNFTNQSTTWSGAYLTTVVVTAVHNSWWNALVGDSNPDLYIKITDSNGNLLYVSDYKEDCGLDTQFPVIFRLSNMVKIPTNGGYKIEIWDEDVGDDTQGSSITLSSNAEGKYTWGNSSSNTEGYCNISLWHPALDVQWGLEKTWDFYNSAFNLQGFDGNNTLTRAMLHSPREVSNIAAEVRHSIFNTQAMEPNNAFAHSPEDVSGAYLFFGMGNEDGESLVDLNCITHEFTHLVTAYRPKGKLVYQGESGAINEGYSDAMAVAAEALLSGSANWLFGHGVQQLGFKGIVYDYCRNLANPKEGGPEGPKPDTYDGQNWYDPTNTSLDYGGVHMNNSIFTHWFYILCEGKTGVNDNQQSYSVSPIGMEKALKIIWRMHRTYLPAQATYAQARLYAIQSAKDLYPNDNTVERCVTNAWYAVGVGDAYVDDAEPFILTPGKYVIVANRDKTGDKNWYYMTSDLGTASTKRFQAVSTETENFEDIVVTELEDKYVWELEADGNNWKLKNGTQYISWSSGNSSKLDATGKSLTFEIEENQVQAHFNDGTNERYLSLNATTGNNYFAFYSGTNQISYLFFLPYEEETPEPPQPETNNYVVLAQRNATSNWFYMTSDLGTASNKRYQAIDAGTANLADVNTSNLDSKYYWQIEENKLHTAAGYSTWSSGNTANLDNTGKDLTITQQSDGTYTFSFADGADTRYLALNATAGNNYFAYYKGTGQIYKLTLVKEGANGPTTAIGEINSSSLQGGDRGRLILHNGQIFILRGDKTYTLTGQEIIEP